MTQTKSQQTETLPPTRFTGRLVEPRSWMVDAPPQLFMADPGRFQLYADWSSPWSQRCTLVIALAGLTDVVRVFYVDTDYGRKRLRNAYQASDSYYPAAIVLPTLWDGETGHVVSNDHSTIEVDLAAELRDWSTTGLQLYPPDLREEIDELDRTIGPAVNQGAFRAIGVGGDAGRARVILHDALGWLDRRLGRSRYLLGDRLTLADVRLWVTLVRLAPPADDRERIGAQLSPYRSLWAYAQSLYEQDAFARTTDPTTFSKDPAGARLSALDLALARST
ncbi:MAG TPA: glutathione S-transferase C-terminal domain-containing protein [Kineosporiaceae bacterium]|nr:glutathione S-transferase C-terminal domain-containing protein [Kineosporiaceae bacterium]